MTQTWGCILEISTNGLESTDAAAPTHDTAGTVLEKKTARTSSRLAVVKITLCLCLFMSSIMHWRAILLPAKESRDPDL